jgi:hypothetical protein
MSDGLAAACSELRGWLAIAETLLAARDQQPSVRVAGQPASRPPWNSAVADALDDARAGIRRLEADMYLEIFGKPRRARGSSDGNTTAAIKAVAAMETAVTRDHAKEAAHALARWAAMIRRLPAVDDLPHWIRIRPGPDGLPPKCPFCGTFSLRLAMESGLVACWMPGCADSDGRRPQAHLDISRITGSPVLVWQDGVVAHE